MNSCIGSWYFLNSHLAKTWKCRSLNSLNLFLNIQNAWIWFKFCWSTANQKCFLTILEPFPNRFIDRPKSICPIIKCTFQSCQGILNLIEFNAYTPPTQCNYHFDRGLRRISCSVQIFPFASSDNEIINAMPKWMNILVKHVQILYVSHWIVNPRQIPKILSFKGNCF